MRTRRWTIRTVVVVVTAALVAWLFHLDVWVGAGALAAVPVVGCLYVYLVVFGRPSAIVGLDDVRDDRWHTVRPPGVTMSSDGSDYAIFVRKGRSPNLVIQFSGGGACWDGHSAANPIRLRKVLLGYTRELKVFYFRSMTRLFPKALGGLADADDPANAFRDWSIVFLPYSTGDLHIGDARNVYTDRGRDITVHHHGRGNVQAALTWIYANFGDVDKLLVSGESSGAWASAFYVPLVADHYPAARIYCLSDGAGLRSSRWEDIVTTTWRADTRHVLGFVPADDPYEGALLRRTDGTHRAIRYLHANTIYDDTLTRFAAVLNGLTTDTTGFIDQWASDTTAMMKRVSESDVDYAYFLTDWGHNLERHTTPHTVTTNNSYTTCEADGIAFAQWLRRNVIDDEHLSLGSRFLNASGVGAGAVG